MQNTPCPPLEKFNSEALVTRSGLARLRSLLIGAALIGIGGSLNTQAANRTWQGASGGSWNTSSNWLGGTPGSADVAIFNTNISSVNTSAAQNVSGISFDTNAGSITIGSTSGSTMNLTSAGTIQILSTLTGTGKTETINSPIIFGGATANATYTFANLSADSSNTMVFGGAISGGTGTGNSTLQLSGNNTGANLISGSIGNGTNPVNLTKGGLGTWALSGANTYTGATRITGGTLDLGGGTGTGSINSASALDLNGGSLLYTRTGNQTQTFASTSVSTGASRVSVVAGNTLALATISRVVGGTVDFSGAGTITTSSTANTNGIMTASGGAFATFGGTTWAVTPASSGGAISGLADASYLTTATAGNTAANYLSSSNVDVNSSQSLSGAVTVNSLRFNTASAATLSLAGTNIIGTGGILVTNNVGGNLSTIAGGSLAGSSGKDLVVIQNNTDGALAISSTIANNGGATGLTKSGAGILILTGTNTYTGTTRVNEGQLDINSSRALGTGSLVISSVAKIDNTSGSAITLATVTPITLAGDLTFGGTYDLNLGTGAVSFSNVLAGTGGTRTVTLEGTGSKLTLGSLAGSAVSASVNFTVNGAGNTLEVGSLSTGAPSAFTIFGTGNMAVTGAISGPAGASLGFASSGTLTLSGTSTYNGTTSVHGGMLVVGANALSGSNGALGNSVTAVNLGNSGVSQAAGILTNGAFTVSRNITEATGALNSSLTIGGIHSSGTSVYSGTITLTKDTILTAASGGEVNFSGLITDGSNTTAITKTGSGVVVFSRATGNTYDGGTTVTLGTLLVNNTSGSGLGAGAVVVTAGTLGGSGAVSGNVTIGNGTGGSDSFISPGNSPGTFTTTGSLSLLSDATFVFELNSSTLAADQIVANGVTLDPNSKFSFTDLGSGVLVAGTEFLIIDNTSGSTISGQFGNLANGSTFTSGANQFQVNYAGGTGNDLVLTVVPEPSAAALALLGIGAVLLRSRRRAVTQR